MLDFYEKISLFEDEDVAGVFRLSAVIMAKGLILPVVGLFLVFLFMFPLFREGGVGVIIFFVALFVIALFALRPVVRWYGTLFVVTNKRIFRIIRHGLFKKNVEEINLDLVGGVSYGTTGVFETLAQAGTMKLTFKDAARAELAFPFVSEPGKMLDTISRQLHGQPIHGGSPKSPKGAVGEANVDEHAVSAVIEKHDNREEQDVDEEGEAQFTKKKLPLVKPAFSSDDGDIEAIWK